MSSPKRHRNFSIERGFWEAVRQIFKELLHTFRFPHLFRNASSLPRLHAFRRSPRWKGDKRTTESWTKESKPWKWYAWFGKAVTTFRQNTTWGKIIMVTALNVPQRACSKNAWLREEWDTQDQRLLDHGQGIWPSRQKPKRCTSWFACGFFFCLGFLVGFFLFLKVTKFSYGWETNNWSGTARFLPAPTRSLPLPGLLAGGMSWSNVDITLFPFLCSFLNAVKYGVANFISFLSCSDDFPAPTCINPTGPKLPWSGQAKMFSTSLTCPTPSHTWTTTTPPAYGL